MVVLEMIDVVEKNVFTHAGAEVPFRFVAVRSLRMACPPPRQAGPILMFGVEPDFKLKGASYGREKASSRGDHRLASRTRSFF